MGGLIERIESNVLPVISKSAPLLASALGSPLAGMAMSLIASVFGVDSKNVAEINRAITLDPEAALKLQKLENEHREALEKIASADYATEVDDRKNARAREISLHDYVPTILALGFLLNYAGVQFYCLTHNNTINDIISARFQDVLIMIMSYYFGSSHRRKSVS